MTARKDVTPADKEEAEKKYGNVTYADEKNKKYPIDTEEHVRAAWSYINMPKNAAKYSPAEVASIKSKIKSAAKKYKISINASDETTEKINLSDKQLIEKQILRVGEWKHRDAPGGKLTITPEYLKEVYDNFKEAKSPVPVYRGHRDNAEAEENPDLILAKNIEGLSLKNNALYAQFKADPSEIDKYNDASASINPLYEDHESGKFLGKVLNHVAIVMNPYIKGLETFTKLSDKQGNFNILLSEINMDEQENPTVPSETEVPEVVTETETKPEEETPTVEAPAEVKQEEITKEEPKVEETPANLSESSQDIQARLVKLEETNRELKSKILLQEAEKNYETLLRKGKILPSMKNEFIALSQQGSNLINLSDGSKKTISELLINLFDSLPVLVNLKEKGINVEESDGVSSVLLSEMKKSYMNRNPKATEDDWNTYINDPIAKREIQKATIKK